MLDMKQSIFERVLTINSYVYIHLLLINITMLTRGLEKSFKILLVPASMLETQHFEVCVVTRGEDEAFGVLY